MAGTGSPAPNIVYDLVSIQYHALKGAQVYDQYLQDAQGNQDIQNFIQQVMKEDAGRAERCHELLKQVTGDSISDAYPSGGSRQSAGTTQTATTGR